MRRYTLTAAMMVAGVVALWASFAHAEEFFAGLIGVDEIPANRTDGNGTLRLDLDKKSNTATYTLTFSDLSAPVTQAHIHFGKVHVAGGIFVWLCGTQATPGPAGTPTCQSPVTGTITASSIVSPGTGTPPSNQGIAAGDFDAFEDALESNTAYANVHTTNFPAGEIRGQIRPD